MKHVAICRPTVLLSNIEASVNNAFLEIKSTGVFGTCSSGKVWLTKTMHPYLQIIWQISSVTFFSPITLEFLSILQNCYSQVTMPLDFLIIFFHSFTRKGLRI